MKVSRAWLQDYFKDKLPSAEAMADMFTFHSFEVEGIERVGSDDVLDLKVLPDRANYALSHRGIAREFSYASGLTLNKERTDYPHIDISKSQVLEQQTRDERCLRDTKFVIQNIKNSNSPAWLKEKLEALGQRSISFIVDVTNYVMLDMGQPLHAFDLDKLTKKDGKVNLILKDVETNQNITILGGKSVMLEKGTLVFADGNNEEVPLDIAGIKGGAIAEIDEHTKNIVVLASNYDPGYIRKTSTKVGIRTDASKRSENGLPADLTMDALFHVAKHILAENKHAVIEGFQDHYLKPQKQKTILITTEYISDLLGVFVSESKIISILEAMDINVAKQNDALSLEIPYYRLDLNIPQDIAEEVGRLYGYDKITAQPLPKIEKTSINKTFYWSEKIKDFLMEKGYSEVFTYSLRNTGEVEIQNPLARDKGCLRADLYEGIEDALRFNTRNAPFLGQEEIKIFEIGNVFLKGEEEALNLSFGYCSTKNIKHKEKVALEHIEMLVKELGEKLGVELKGLIEASDAGVIFEEDVSALVERLPEPHEWDITPTVITKKFKPYSPYPFATRDIAVFTPEGTTESEPLAIIIREAGDLLVRHSLFDVFTKKFPDGTQKTSYAFRLVFQSFERTLTEDELNATMQRITQAMNSQEGWQVR